MRRRSEAKARPQRTREVPLERQFGLDVPNDPMTEQVLLAAMLADEEACDRLLPMLPIDAFYAEEHRTLRDAIGEARRKKLSLDPAILMRLNTEVDDRLIGKLRTSRPDLPEDLDWHVDELLWDRHRRNVTEGPIDSLIHALQNPNEDRDRVRTLARQIGEAFAEEHGHARHILNSSEVVRQTMAALRKRTSSKTVYPFGIPELDFFEDGSRRLRPGANPGGWTLVSSLSGSGKTTFMCHLALGIGRQRRKVCFGAWEDEAPVTLELLATLNLGWSRSRVLDGKSHHTRTEGGDDWAPMTREDLVTFEEECHKISRWITFFENPFQIRRTNGPRPTNDLHLEIIALHLADSGCEVFMADLLHRCFVEDSPSEEKRALFGLLDIVQKGKVHMIAAHQQRAKDIETRVDKRPTREGIIGAGAWLDVPWVVMAPHLPGKWKAVPDNTMELYILKQRQGPWPLAVEFDWDPDTGQIANGRSMDVKATIDSSDGAFGIVPAGGKKHPTKARATKAFRSR